ncbi:MAG: enoyl-CoA hydratase [Pseudomonadales bacterium RIFCSPHIGHO2_12_FULL_40_16]|nr:MAG: enoyl-CoA hydratase [Pseudomonadales bacterium RIFCSPHIGHO2_12_FULL_40_16]HLB42688.1 enoyl-CoA hydratase-related protein [Gammaproteobacteria bacterium]
MSVELTYQNDIAIITLNRLEAKHALNAAMIEKLSELFDELRQAKPRALVITSAGGNAFCAGADIAELQARSPDEHYTATRKGQLAFAKLDQLPFPSIAAIDGVALGGGLELAMACTYRIASLGSRFALPEIKLGLIPGYGGTQRLVKLAGFAKASEMVLSGNMIHAVEALDAGLLNAVSDQDNMVRAAVDYINALGQATPAAMALALSALKFAQENTLEQGLAYEADCFKQAVQSQDAAEGIRAFLEKRKPAFTGQ